MLPPQSVHWILPSAPSARNYRSGLWPPPIPKGTRRDKSLHTGKGRRPRRPQKQTALGPDSLSHTVASTIPTPASSPRLSPRPSSDPRDPAPTPIQIAPRDMNTPAAIIKRKASDRWLKHRHSRHLPKKVFPGRGRSDQKELSTSGAAGEPDERAGQTSNWHYWI